MRSPSHLLVATALCTIAACAGTHPRSRTATPSVSPRTSSSAAFASRDTGATDFSGQSLSPLPDDVELARRSYNLARSSANPDSPATIQADALAEEAATLALLGEEEIAISYWEEALFLLDSSAADSTSTAGSRGGR